MDFKSAYGTRGITDLANLRGEIKPSLSKHFIINNGLKQSDALSCILFNLLLKKLIHDADVNARSTILDKSTLLLAYGDDIVSEFAQSIVIVFPISAQL